MDLAEYMRNVSFRVIDPTNCHRGVMKLNGRFRFANLVLELMNTKLPVGQIEMQRRLYDLLKIPRMSTFAIGAIINKGVSELSGNCSFVNVGVWQGFTFLAGIKENYGKTCVGIDNFSEFGGPRESFQKRFHKYKADSHTFYDMDFRDYFSKKHTGKIGLYLYDGDHTYNNQLLGLKVAEPFFSETCYILVDDTNWKEPRQATLDFIAQSNYKYEILLDQTTCGNGHPTFWNGLLAFRRA